MSRYRVVVPENRFHNYDEESRLLAEVEAEVVVCNCKSAGELHEAVRDADGILLSQIRVDRAAVECMKHCKVISRYGIGYDNVDVAAATQAGIWVARVPNYGAEEPVADQALALLMGCVRKVSYKDRRIREGAWNVKDEQPCYKIEGKTLGIIGFGTIGRRMRRKCSGLGLARVLVDDPYVDPQIILADGAVPVDKQQLLREADFVSVHAPLTDETRNLIDAGALSLMKPTAILVNTSRGPLVNEEALVEALMTGRINSAGLDVFHSEPLPPDHPLKRLDNVILSDHTGFYSEETMATLQRTAAQNIVEVLKGRPPLHPVNQLNSQERRRSAQ
jgi:D-3-phosphoglycerate dehydrogenase / 2-oxoglutarate reductase